MLLIRYIRALPARSGRLKRSLYRGQESAPDTIVCLIAHEHKYSSSGVTMPGPYAYNQLILNPLRTNENFVAPG
jgi:hypothetical protein